MKYSFVPRLTCLKSLKGILMLLAGLSAFGSSAASITCSGHVSMIAYHAGASSGYMLQLDSMNVPVFICNADSTWSPAGSAHSTFPESCSAMISVFMTAKASESAMSQVVFDGDDVPATCDGWNPWDIATVLYFQF